MYRGNLPGQYNGSGMQAGQEYNPSYAGRGMPIPGQPRMQAATQGGMPGAQMSEMHRFQNSSYPTGASQASYPGTPGAPGAYSNDPYGYSQNKMMAIAGGGSNYQPSMSTGTQPSHMYPASVSNQPRGYMTSNTGELSTSDSISVQQYRLQQSKGAHHWSSGKPVSEMMQTYGPSDSIGSMYNGSQYMSASSQNPEQAPGMQGHTRLSLSSQPPSSYPGGETAPLRGGMPSYQQQRSAAVQYQMRPGMNSGTPVAPGSTAMYMHQAQQYPGQPGQRVPGPPQTSMYAPQHLTSSASIVAGSKHPGSAGQYDEASAQMAMSQQQSMQLQNQATMQGNAPAQMKPGAPYRPKMGPSPSHSHPGPQPSQMMGVPSRPMQQAMSPRQGSPLSPMRNPIRQGSNLPPASPQMQSSRTTPQYPAPQASPHMHSQGPMSPLSARLPNYSPKQTMNQQYPNAGQTTPNFRPSVTPSPNPHTDQGIQGFKSPTHMMSPPPPTNQGPSPVSHPQMPRMHAAYNGDISMQQQHGYYGPTGRYPHGSWQGPRHPAPRMSTAQPHQSPMGMPRQMMPGQPPQPRYSQPHLVYKATGPQPPTASSATQPQFNLQQVMASPNQAPADRSKAVTNGAVPVPSSIAPTTQPVQSSEFDNEFNLESLLGEPLDTSGSFMQQLQDVTPSEAPTTTEVKTSNVPDSTLNPTVQSDVKPTVPIPEIAPSETPLAEPMPQTLNQPETPTTQQDQASKAETAPSENSLNDSGSVASMETNTVGDMKTANSVASSENSGDVEQALAQTPEKEATSNLAPDENEIPPTVAPTPTANQHTADQSVTSLSPVKQQTAPPAFAGPESVPISSPTAEPKPPSLHQNAIFPPQTVTFPPAPSSVAAPFPHSPRVPGAYRPGIVPATSAGHPARHPNDPAYPTHSNQYRPVHTHNVPGMPPQIPRSGPPAGAPTSIHPHDNPMVRAPHYPAMHPQHQYPPRHPHAPPPHGSHPYYGPQSQSGPYPQGPPHVRPPYSQPGGPMGPRGYMGPGQRHPYPAQPPMHPNQQQLLQQRLQAFRHEAQQLQAQLQRAQQEEADSTEQQPPEQPPRSEQIRGRLMEVDRSIRQIMSQLQHAPHHMPGVQDGGPPMTQLQAPPGFPPHDAGSPGKMGEDPMTPGGKKKRPRKPKAPKTPKVDAEGKKVKAPPKKKKKKDTDDGSDGGPGEKKKKKKIKKLDKERSAVVSEDETSGDSMNNDARDETFVPDPDDSSQSHLLDLETTKKIKSSSANRKRKPPATLVKPKKKRKRGYDSGDEMNATDVMHPTTPPASPEDSLIEKRRSGRNVKRKRYTEAMDIQFSGDDEELVLPAESEKKHQLVEMDETTEDEIMIVDKILSHRIRKKRVKRKSETIDEIAEEAPSATEIDVEGVKVGPMLSPTSLKNPRIRKLSMGPQDNEEEVEGEGETEFYLKYKNYSYLHCEWKLKEEVEDKRFDQKLKRYIAKNTNMIGELIFPEIEEDEIFNPDFVEVDRVLDVMVNEDKETGKSTRHFLVKWCSLAYEDSTWESEDDIDKIKIQEFESRCKFRPPSKKLRPHKDMWKRMSEDNTVFQNNNQLRDYQFEGLNWLLFNWYNKRNCILADEMGLGKTIQSITFLQKIFDHGIWGPFLVVAPLSTIANWQREFESWTTINAVVYHGSQTSRDMLHTYEWFCRDENLEEIPGCYKVHAVITTYEMIVLDSSHLRDVDWRCLIIDEAHRLKNLSCKLVESLSYMQLEHKVLLTGTPLQNNVEELFALLSFLQPETFNCQQAFSLEFGNLKNNAQVEKLQALLKPMMLRRLKEDVEKSLAPKQETIIEVELTSIQKKYYRAILERNFEFLAKGTSGGNVPNLMNTMMELRKCCNHPYLIKGAEDKIMQEYRMMSNEQNPLQAMIQSSGKLVLIDKLLPRLKEGGHKVLVFSQMVRVLDILEDYLVQRSYLYERIDGCIRGNERQMAIDRFSKKGSDRFVFLLCTRAGGLGINLTAADTVIIFDSDWNPQNDLQAQARCHRIGQQKPVKIYRLITRNSYEREMFDKASLKLGLDKAVLQSISGRQDQVTNQNQAPQLSKTEVEDLLKRGAYGAIMDDDEAASKFCEEDIDQILDRRAHTVTLESGEKGSTFSKASFVSNVDHSDISLDDPNFWEKWAKKADLDLKQLKDNKLILEIPRHRKQTRRFGGNSDDAEIFAEIGSESEDSEFESGDERNEGRSKKSKFRSRAGGAGGGQRKGWGRRDCFRIEKCLLTYGWGRWTAIQTRGRFSGAITHQELEELSRVVLMYCLKYYNGDEKIKYFMWDLITPTEVAITTGVDLRNHEGLSAPVPRGRKGKRAKEESTSGRHKDEQSKREWAADIDIDALLPDEGFRKHIQHQCNKVLLRVRMLYYLRVEILGSLVTAIDEGAKPEALDMDIIDRIPDPPAAWWDADCDKSLLVGIYKHGYEKYCLIRSDSSLCFLERVGPPDDRLLAAEANFEPEDTDGDPEYKPTRITFTEMEFDDSPAPGTPNTEPASPASDAKKMEKDEDAVVDEIKRKTSLEAATGGGMEWPTVSELNTRFRRIITLYQKHHKHMQQRLMNIERRCGRPRYQDNRDSRRPVLQTRWTRREEADFYRTVSTFGIERDPRTGEFLWRRFRNIARLDRKTDESLRSYYLAFRNMCEQVCRWKEEPGTSDGTNIGLTEEIPNIDVDPITEERASRTLYRIRLLDKIRTEILPHPKLKERLAMCQRSPELPIWWRSGVHDHELLVAMDRHGVTRTEIHTLNDASLSFLNAMREYESNPTAFKQQILAEEKAELENLMKIMKKEEEEKAALLEAEAKSMEESKAADDVLKEKDQNSEDKEQKSDNPDKKDDDVNQKTEASEQKDEEKAEKLEKDGVKSEDDDKTHDESDPVVEDDILKTEDQDMEVEEGIPKEANDVEVKVETEVTLRADVEQETNEDPATPKDSVDAMATKEKDVDALVEDAAPKEEDALENQDSKVEDNEEVQEHMEESSSKEESKPEPNPVEDSPVEQALKQEDVGKEEAMSPSDKEVADLSIKKEDDPDVKKEPSNPEENGASDLTEEKSSKVETSEKEDPEKQRRAATPVQMSLRSKSNPMSHDLFNAINSNYGGFLISSMMSQSTSGRWPKDRVLIQRVEQVCYCILNGEWPSPSQTFPSAIPGQIGSFLRPGTPSSHPSTPLSDGRVTPLSSAGFTPSQNTITSTADFLAASEKQLQAAMAQMLAAGAVEPPMRSSSSRRGRRRRRPDPPMQSSLASGLQFSAQSLSPMDKALQRKIEQLMAANNASLSFAPSPTTQQNPLFATQGGKFSSVSTKSSSSNKDEELGNSSASLLANLREMAKSESKEPSTSRGRPRSNSSYRHLSASPSQSRSKETSSKQQNELMKMPFMQTPEQLMSSANNPNAAIQQMMQDAMKAGVDPMSAAAAAFLPFFPMLDPFQMMNKPDASSMPPMLPPSEMEKLLKSMGLPPELAMMQGLLPGGMPPPTTSGKTKEQDQEQKSSSSLDVGKPKESSEKSIASLLGEKRTTPQRRGGSKLDAMFGGPKMDEESPGKSNKKSRKSKFVSPAMLPLDTRIPVVNNTEGVRLSGDDAPLNEDLADWLKNNSGFVLDYQTLRQQLDESGGKKIDPSDTTLEMSGQESDPMISPKPSASPKTREFPSKGQEMLAEADKLLKDAEKLAMSAKRLESDDTRIKTPDKQRPSSVLPTSSAPTSSGRASTSSSMKQQMSELGLLQQMNAGAMNPDPSNPFFSLPPEVLNNLANLPPDIAALLAGGLLPPGVTPEMLMGLKPAQGSPRVVDDKHSNEQSPSRSSTPSRGSPSQRHNRPRSSHQNPEKGPPSDPSQLTGEERVTVVNLTSGKKLTGRQAPELQTLSDYLRVYPDVVVSPDWSNVIRKSKFLPKDLHTRLLPSQSPTSKSSSSSHSVSSASQAGSNAAVAAALGGLPPGAANMFPGLMQAQGLMMPDPMQLMAALQSQGQMNDLKALSAAGFPMLPFFGGMPNPLLGGGFPGQDPATVAAMAALSQGATPSSSSKKESRTPSHERDRDRGRKSKKHNERSSSGNRSSSSSNKPTTSTSFNDPMAEALAALQRGGGVFPGMGNPFLAGAGGNPMLFPHMMMGAQNQGLNSLLGLPMDMMSPELLSAQMAALGGIPGMEPTSKASSSGGKHEGKQDQRKSSSKHKESSTSGHRSQSRGADEQPMDLTQFAGGATKDRQTPDKHKH